MKLLCDIVQIRCICIVLIPDINRNGCIYIQLFACSLRPPHAVNETATTAVSKTAVTLFKIFIPINLPFHDFTGFISKY